MVIDFSHFLGRQPELERLLDLHWSPGSNWRAQPPFPLMNVSHDETAIHIHCQTPGVAMEDVEITLTENTLVIKGERRPVQGAYYRQERPSGPFQRVVGVNAPVDREAVTARLKDGILTITLPRLGRATPRKITISA